MKVFLIVLAAFVVLILILAYICYRMAFSVPEKDPGVPTGEVYAELKTDIHELYTRAASLPSETVHITSADGLRLEGRYYGSHPGAPTDVLCHGWHGEGIRDFCGGLNLVLESGHNVLLIDERAHRNSEGRCTTFGVKESDDIVRWTQYLADRFGPDMPIFLIGISMGAASVLIAAADSRLPASVKGVMADSAFTHGSAIIRSVAESMHVPWFVGGPLVHLAARLYGGFSLNSKSALKACADIRIPALFIHGEDDHFVPCAMGRANYEACPSDKVLLTVPGADHGLSYPVDRDAYTKAVHDLYERALP